MWPLADGSIPYGEDRVAASCPLDHLDPGAGTVERAGRGGGEVGELRGGPQEGAKSERRRGRQEDDGGDAHSGPDH